MYCWEGMSSSSHTINACLRMHWENHTMSFQSMIVSQCRNDSHATLTENSMLSPVMFLHSIISALALLSVGTFIWKIAGNFSSHSAGHIQLLDTIISVTLSSSLNPAFFFSLFETHASSGPISLYQSYHADLFLLSPSLVTKKCRNVSLMWSILLQLQLALALIDTSQKLRFSILYEWIHLTYRVSFRAKMFHMCFVIKAWFHFCKLSSFTNFHATFALPGFILPWHQMNPHNSFSISFMAK